MNTVPFILGPTAIGKTEISLQLEKHFPIEIISADSRQIYKYLDIGTAKPSKDILKRIKHHFIDHLFPDDYYSAGMFGREARKVIEQVFGDGKVPVVVGGSGFYIQALIDGLSDIKSSDTDVRKALRRKLEKSGLDILYAELKSVDPELAISIKMQDKQRILRGLEVYYSTGIPMSNLQLQAPSPANFKAILIGLTADREFLYEKINNRVDEMISDGLVDEVKKLQQNGFNIENNALNTVGYKEVFDYLDGKIDHDMMIETIKKNSRRYAKRQMTWFKRDDRIIWFKIDKNTQTENLTMRILTHINKAMDEHHK
jgi:tRNA dimethylallyltransferase